MPGTGPRDSRMASSRTATLDRRESTTPDRRHGGSCHQPLNSMATQARRSMHLEVESYKSLSFGNCRSANTRCQTDAQLVASGLTSADEHTEKEPQILSMHTLWKRSEDGLPAPWKWVTIDRAGLRETPNSTTLLAPIRLFKSYFLRDKQNCVDAKLTKIDANSSSDRGTFSKMLKHPI